MPQAARPEILYHFTSRPSWHFIRREGIDRGDAPISTVEALNHPNLTANPDPAAQKWCMLPELMDYDGLIRKNSIRIAVRIPPGDGRLVSFRDFADAHKMSRRDYRELDETGGYQARHWWIFQGPVPPEWFVGAQACDGGRITFGEAVMLEAAAAAASYDEMLAAMGMERDGRLTQFIPR